MTDVWLAVLFSGPLWLLAGGLAVVYGALRRRRGKCGAGMSPCGAAVAEVTR